jgi:hypothetical protein
MTSAGPPIRTLFADAKTNSGIATAWIKWFQALPTSIAAAEVPAGAINGINQVYTLAKGPNPPAALLLFMSGHLQRQGVGVEYTLAGATITMAVAPGIGAWLLAWYLC